MEFSERRVESYFFIITGVSFQPCKPGQGDRAVVLLREELFSSKLTSKATEASAHRFCANQQVGSFIHMIRCPFFLSPQKSLGNFARNCTINLGCLYFGNCKIMCLWSGDSYSTSKRQGQFRACGAIKRGKAKIRHRRECWYSTLLESNARLYRGCGIALAGLALSEQGQLGENASALCKFLEIVRHLHM